MNYREVVFGHIGGIYWLSDIVRKYMIIQPRVKNE